MGYGVGVVRLLDTTHPKPLTPNHRAYTLCDTPPRTARWGGIKLTRKSQLDHQGHADNTLIPDTETLVRLCWSVKAMVSSWRVEGRLRSGLQKQRAGLRGQGLAMWCASVNGRGGCMHVAEEDEGFERGARAPAG